MNIPFYDLKKANELYKEEISQSLKRVLLSGWYIMGKELESFERKFAKYCGTKYAVGTGNGLDSLILILKAYKKLEILKSGDEVMRRADRTSIHASWSSRTAAQKLGLGTSGRAARG